MDTIHQKSVVLAGIFLKDPAPLIKALLEDQSFTSEYRKNLKGMLLEIPIFFRAFGIAKSLLIPIPSSSPTSLPNADYLFLYTSLIASKILLGLEIEDFTG